MSSSAMLVGLEALIDIVYNCKYVSTINRKERKKRNILDTCLGRAALLLKLIVLV